MVKISLKNIIGKNKDANSVVLDLIEKQGTVLWIEDENGKLLLGNPGAYSSYVFPINFLDETLGFVKGDDDKAKSIADLLSFLIQKEAEKKKLGTEVLNLYQEINVIFNFSEKLSQAIEPDVIAGFTLEQAMNSIPAHSGVVILWNEQKMEMELPAFSGERLFHEDQLKENTELLLRIGLNGHSEIINDLQLLREKKIVTDEVQSLVYAAMKVKHRIMGAIILAGNDTEQFSAGHLKLLVTLALQSSSAIESAMLYEQNIRAAREREEAMLRIHEVTKKFVPNEFIRALGKEELTDIKLGDQAEKIVTVLFTDIRDFTSLSEMMTPEENFNFVSSFNARLGPIIRSNNGFINQYLGDSIMAIFPDNAEDALRAAIEMRRALFEFNAERNLLGMPPIGTGIGMHTGPLIMGITGDDQRLDAATISDTVNTASRIESLTKYYKSPLLLSQETFQHLGQQHHFSLRHLGKVRLKGKHKLLNIVECLDGHDGQSFEKKKSTLPVFQEALSLYHKQQFENATQLFNVILESDPDDLTARYFVENAARYLQEGVPGNWTGTLEMLNK